MVPSGHRRDGGSFPHGNASRISPEHGVDKFERIEDELTGNAVNVLLVEGEEGEAAGEAGEAAGEAAGENARTCVIVKAGCVEFADVELQADDREHEDGKEEQQTNLQ